MPALGPRTAAAVGVVLGVATGVVTNLLTDRWSWSLGAALLVLVAAAAFLATRGAAVRPNRTRARQTATRGGRIIDSDLLASNGADAAQRARHDGLIERSPLTAEGADAEQHADRHGTISDSELRADP